MRAVRGCCAIVALAAITLCALPLRVAAQVPSTDVARLARELLERTYAADAPGAAVLVARGDEVLLRDARGAADIETGRALTPDDRFQIASLTKQMVAAGVLTLVEAGKVSLDDPLSKYVQGFRHGDRIVVAQLLNHTSGIRNFPDADVLQAKLPQNASTDQLIDAFKDQPPDFAPGERWAYADIGYVLAGKIIETVTGRPWHVYVAQTFFLPLGMTHTCYCADSATAAGYAMEAGNARRVGPTNISWEHAAGALVSTVDDLLKWNRALHEGRIVAPRLYRRMVTPQGRAADGGMHYGFGIDHTPLHGQEQLSHSGYVDGFTSHLLYMPGPRLTVVVLRNGSGAGEGPAETARKLASAAIGLPSP
ncbi:MAG TPA: serine hydrolase domain-containing protein [Albitalea sp.]|nr:serine hydrolase domain-containing protein [Albitalea sp.]